MVGSEDGQYDLELVEVTPEDAGQYQCQVLASPGSPPLRSRLCTLIGPDTVLSLVRILPSDWSSYCPLIGPHTVLSLVQILSSHWSRNCQKHTAQGTQSPLQATRWISCLSLYLIRVTSTQGKDL